MPDAWVSPEPETDNWTWDAAGPPVDDNGHCFCAFGIKPRFLRGPHSVQLLAECISTPNRAVFPCLDFQRPRLKTIERGAVALRKSSLRIQFARDKLLLSLLQCMFAAGEVLFESCIVIRFLG